MKKLKSLKGFLRETFYRKFTLSKKEYKMEKEKGYLSEVSAITLKYKFHCPPENPLVFYGSSNFKKWTSLETDFSGYNALNHGFGGSNDRDLLTYAEKLVLSLSPKTLVLNTSSNDVYAGFSDDEIMENRKKLLETFAPIENVLVLSVIRGVISDELEARFEGIDERVKALCDRYENATFLDVTSPLDRNAHFEDNHHLNPLGREVLKSTILTKLKEIYDAV